MLLIVVCVVLEWMGIKMKLIDADKLIEKLEALADSYFDINCSDFTIGVHNLLRQQGVDASIEVAKEQIPIDAVKHGHWIHGSSSENIRVTCSECGYKVNYFWDSWQDAKYCPNCGAKMSMEDL